MQNVVLLHPPLLFYKVRIYNKLAAYLRERGYNLIVWPTRIETADERMEFNCIDAPMNLAALRHVLRSEKIDIVVNHLARRSVNVRFYVMAAVVVRLSGRRLLYYGHGLNLSRRDSALEILLSNLYLLLCSRVILFSPDEMGYLWNRNQRKVTVAYNTLDMEGIVAPAEYNRTEVAVRYGITESRIVLFSGRIWPRKRLDVLVDCFLQNREALGDVGMVIVGPGMPEELMDTIHSIPNIHYLGPIYERERMAELFSVADVYCIPGSMGLGIVEALCWGKPIITLNVKHGPEAYYLRNGRNCVIVHEERHLAGELLSLLHDDDRLKTMSEEARRTFDQEASLDRMFEGFYDGLRLSSSKQGTHAASASHYDRVGV